MENETHANRMTQLQREKLLSWVAEHPQVMSRVVSTPDGRREIANLWEDAAALLNNMEGGNRKTGDGWKRAFVKLKSSLKNAEMNRRKSRVQTGGGSNNVPNPSVSEAAVIGLMGTEPFGLEGVDELGVSVPSEEEDSDTPFTFSHNSATSHTIENHDFDSPPMFSSPASSRQLHAPPRLGGNSNTQEIGTPASSVVNNVRFAPYAIPSRANRPPPSDAHQRSSQTGTPPPAPPGLLPTPPTSNPRRRRARENTLTAPQGTSQLEEHALRQTMLYYPQVVTQLRDISEVLRSLVDVLEPAIQAVT